ncbi:ras-related protein Rab11B-like [Rutidosis leptorrhynchoides]|uniref:ras-related protein Rab11B-like n=1 Tax=Rutidosis leptorrhynchoides TaxID=125765 RepID=UPI003A9A2789
MDFDELYKLILMGDPCVGKTNLLSRFSQNKFIHEHKSTIGVEFATRDVDIDNKIIRLQIWETGGYERYRAIPSSMYRNAIGAFIVYDITSIRTFENAIEKWIKELRDYTKDRDVVIMLVGNKTDLSQQR